MAISMLRSNAKPLNHHQSEQHMPINTIQIENERACKVKIYEFWKEQNQTTTKDILHTNFNIFSSFFSSP